MGYRPSHIWQQIAMNSKRHESTRKHVLPCSLYKCRPQSEGKLLRRERLDIWSLYLPKTPCLYAKIAAYKEKDRKVKGKGRRYRKCCRAAVRSIAERCMPNNNGNDCYCLRDIKRAKPLCQCFSYIYYFVKTRQVKLYIKFKLYCNDWLTPKPN